MPSNQTNIIYRPPIAKDGPAVYRLIAQCPPLDTNSRYCNLLQCHHFAATSVIAETKNELVGFISGYIVPERPDCLFVWQVAVNDNVRGNGVASNMLHYILNAAACRPVTHLETTITDNNEASWALFKKLAATHQARLEQSVIFDHDTHFENQHDSERLVRIGPIKVNQALNG